jgi:molecular chaperone GrpE
MEMSESWEINYRDNKDQIRELYVDGDLFRVNDLVESLSSGLVGRVHRRGANHIICITEDGIMFKNFIHDLLNPIDNLELVTNVTTEIPELKAYVDGVNMVKKELLSVIEKEGIKRLNPVNESFDPMLMEAINSVESEEYKEETVVEVYQPGYYYLDGENQHSIRPARVKVGKPLSNG